MIDIDCDDFVKTLDLIKRAYPKKVRRFLQKEGNKLKNKVSKRAKTDVKIKTGNYHKSIKRGKPYVYEGNGGDAVRVYSSAPHAHLIEYGHRQDTKKGEIFVEGKYIFSKTLTDFEPELQKDLNDFVNTVTEEFDD